MKRSLYFLMFLLFMFPGSIFAQTGASVVRDYVGLINQTYHPGIVSFFEKIKKEFEKSGDSDAVKVVDIIIKGGFGSGFLYSDARGNFYVITNNHVIAQAHTVSITFERTDGSKKRIDNLKLIATDTENDLAIMAVPAGEKPLVTQGLALINRNLDEGEEVFSAGFPGLGMTPLWQFANGRISNISAKFPKSFDDETLIGPFIQHTAQIDMGNSGGPLLAVQRNAPSGYAVAGINTLSAARRQAANYAIPLSTFQPFITSSLNPNPGTYRAALDKRLSEFVEGLGANAAVYPHIADYLSTVCIGENVEYAFEEMSGKATSSVKRTFLEKAKEDLISAMGISVAWTIENSIRSNQAIKASLKEVTGENEEYTVVFTINNKDVSSVWIREYGNWRIKTFGAVASGDKTLVEKREKQKQALEKLHLNCDFFIEAGYANVFDDAPAALFASIGTDYLTFNFLMAGNDLMYFGFLWGIHVPIPAGNVGFIPYVKMGIGSVMANEKSSFDMTAHVGLKFTTNYVPGLFLNIGYQFSISSFIDDKKKPFERALTVSAGYTF